MAVVNRSDPTRWREIDGVTCLLCLQCDTWKPYNTDHFRRCKNTLRTTCRTCQAQQMRERYLAVKAGLPFGKPRPPEDPGLPIIRRWAGSPPPIPPLAVALAKTPAWRKETLVLAWREDTVECEV